MTSMRCRYVASTSLRRHVPAVNLPPLAPPPQYSKHWPPQYSKPSYAYVLEQFSTCISSFVSTVVCHCGPVVQITISEAESQGSLVRILRSLLSFFYLFHYYFSFLFHSIYLLSFFSLCIFNYDFPSSC